MKADFIIAAMMPLALPKTRRSKTPPACSGLRRDRSLCRSRQQPERFDPYVTNLTRPLPLTERCQSLLPLVAAGRTTAWQRSATRTLAGAATLIRHGRAASCSSADGAPVHKHLAREWECGDFGGDLIRRAPFCLPTTNSTLPPSPSASWLLPAPRWALASMPPLGPERAHAWRHNQPCRTPVRRCPSAGGPRCGRNAAAARRRRARLLASPFIRKAIHAPRPSCRCCLARPPRRSHRGHGRHGRQAPNIDFALVSLRRALPLRRQRACPLRRRPLGRLDRACIGTERRRRPDPPRARYVGPRRKIEALR